MDEGLDTTPLGARVAGERWRRFRDEARDGHHGADLVTCRWWRPQSRRRFRLHEFARVNGLRYLPEPGLGRIGAHIFISPIEARHLDRLEVPGARGFAIANYEATIRSEGSETDGFHAGYVVFGLRESYPHTLVARRTRNTPRGLRGVQPVDGPDGTKVRSTKPDHPLLRRLVESGVVERSRAIRASEIEIVGDQLFLLNGGFVPLTSPRTWRRLEAIADALAPFLKPAGTNPSTPTSVVVDTDRPA